MALLGLALVFSVPAMAEDEGADAAAEADGTADAAPAATAAGPADEVKPADAKSEYLPRFRVGVWAFGGPVLGGIRGGAGGVNIRLGAQITDMIGVYAQPIAGFGAGVNVDDDSASAGALLFAGTDVMVEFDFLDMIFVGIGPGIMAGRAAGASVTSTSTSAAAYKGPTFDIAARAGLAFGSKTDERRSCFSFGLEFHVMFFGGELVTVSPMIGLGWDRF